MGCKIPIMTRFSFLVAIAMCMASTAAFADEQVLIRSDGQIIDGDGKIIAKPIKNDSRTTEYEVYYQKVDKNGDPIRGSDFYIYADPGKGYMKKTPGSSVTESKVADEAESSSEEQPQNGMVRKYDGNIQLRKNMYEPIYDGTSARTVY
jgi:hypothetical protein